MLMHCIPVQNCREEILRLEKLHMPVCSCAALQVHEKVMFVPPQGDQAKRRVNFCLSLFGGYLGMKDVWFTISTLLDLDGKIFFGLNTHACMHMVEVGGGDP